MKRSEYTKGLVDYILKKDQHLALNIVQTKQLVKYVKKYNDKVGMLPSERTDESPTGYGAAYLDDIEVMKNYFKFKHSWEPEDDS